MTMIANWKIVHLKDTAKKAQNSFIDGDWIEAEHISNEGIRFIQTGNIGIGRFIDKPDNRKFINERSFKVLKCKPVYPGDLLICRLADPIGRTCLVPRLEDFYVTSVDIVIFRVDTINYDKFFLLYSLNKPDTLKRIAELAGGSTRQRISRTNLEHIQISLPALLPEQSKIAEILSTVDEAIDKTEALIQKYQRIKQGLMQDLLTKGIDEEGNIRSEKTHKFKDSPFGRIPEECEVKKLESICKVTSSKRIYLNEYSKDGVLFFRSKEIIQKVSGEKLTNPLYISENKFEKVKKQFGAPEEGDILITSVGTLGVTYLVTSNDKFYFKDGNLIWLRNFNSDIDHYFLALAMSVFIANQIDSLTIGTSQKAFTIEKLKKMNLFFPIKAEQSRIASILSQADKTIQKEQAYKQKLLSLKRGLMEDLLAGKVRVNNLISRTNNP